MKLRLGWERRRNDLNEELEAHLHMAIEDRIARGESLREARAGAMREMGNLPIVADVTRTQWGLTWLERIAQDMRYALRQLRHSPGYTVTALLTITLAVGANTAIFGLLYALLLRSLPVDHPDQIVQLELQLFTPGSSGEPSPNVSDGMYDLLSKSQSSFSGMCGWQNQKVNLHEIDGTRPVPAAALTGGCMRMLGLHAALGREMEETDNRPGGSPEGYSVLLGYDYWRTHFGADPGVIGRVLDFGGGLRAGAAKGVVVGVMQKGFDDLEVGSRPDLYVPMEMVDPFQQRNLGSFDTIVLGRLKNGVSMQTAQAEADTVFQAKLKSDKNLRYFTFVGGKFTQASQAHVIARPGRTGYSYLRAGYQKPLYLIECMVGLSLLVACAYLAILASGRALSRRRELALRMALGASRGRLISQLTWESALLAFAGGAFGISFAWASERMLTSLIKGMSDSLNLHAGPGAVVLVFTVALMGLVVLLSGVWPAWRTSKVNPVSDIKKGEISIVGRSAPRMGVWLVPVQIAFSLVITTIAALMGSTLTRLMAVDPGFRTSGITLLTADFSPRISSSDPSRQLPDLTALFLSLLQRVQHTPGVESVSISQAYPLEGASYLENVSSQTRLGETRTDESLTSLSVSPGYFRTMGVAMLSGRDFTSEDRGKNTNVCIIDRSAAHYFFPDENPIGGVLTMNKDVRMRVVGVVADTLYNDLRQKAPRMIYRPYLQGGEWNPFASFEVRARNTGIAVSAVRNAFRELAPDVAVDRPVTIKELIVNAMGSERMVALLAGFFALLTLTLTAIGLYGVLNYGVVQRRTEIGVRMALGATRGGVVRMILREALRLVLPGIALGSAGVWAATRLLETLLYGVKPLDTRMCAASIAVLAAVALLACLLPARRAARVNPLEALRFE